MREVSALLAFLIGLAMAPYIEEPNDLRRPLFKHSERHWLISVCNFLPPHFARGSFFKS